MFASFQSTSVPFIQILPVPGNAMNTAPYAILAYLLNSRVRELVNDKPNQRATVQPVVHGSRRMVSGDLSARGFGVRAAASTSPGARRHTRRHRRPAAPSQLRRDGISNRRRRERKWSVFD